MSGIKGSKSKFYIKEPLPGIENSSDTLINVTTGELPGARIGLDVIQHGVYEVNNTGIIGAGSAQRIIECINHGASAGDAMKITSGNSLDAEIAIIGVIDADNFVIAYEENLSVGDTFSVLRYVSAKYSQDGSLQVSSGPIQFTKNGSAELVVEDTVTMANNKPMPGGMYIKKDDGSWYPVTLDTTNPYAHTPIPVAITDVTGTSNVNVDLSGSSLSVNIKHDGASPSSIRIGDGTTLTSVTVNNELKVYDDKVFDELVTLNTVGFATETKQDTQITHLSQIETATEAVAATVATEGGAQPATGIIVGGHNGAGFFRHLRVDNTGRLSVDVNSVPNTLATEATLSTLNGKIPSNLSVINSNLRVDGSGVTQPISAASLPLPAGAATDTNQATANNRLGDLTEAAPASDTASSGLNGRLQRIAQRLTSLIALFPTSLGQGTMAQSFRVVLPSDQTVPTQNVGRVASYVQSLTIDGTTQQTFNAPANAKWVKVIAGIDNTVDLMVNFGANATSTIGFEMQSGRSEDFDAVANISVIAKSAATNQKVSIVWGV